MNPRKLPIFGIACLVVSSTCLTVADDRHANRQLSETGHSTELDQHAAKVQALDRRFLEGIRSLEKSYIEERIALRDALRKKLTKEKKTLTKKGKLDRAIVIRDQIERLGATDIVPPNQSDPVGILGTWRWNNGVDIRNLADGKTNGQGTWRLVDPAEQVFEFQWKRIPADRVKLSANGRVLEGTKVTDPSFRVWAVRID
jgi:hypothetical protein